MTPRGGRGFPPPAADPGHPQKMRSYAEEHLDWSVKKLKGFLEALVGEGTGIPEPGTASGGPTLPGDHPGAGEGRIIT